MRDWLSDAQPNPGPRAWAVMSNDAVRIEMVALAEAVVVKTRSLPGEAIDNISEILGAPLPGPGRSARPKGALIGWQAPGTWIVVRPEGAFIPILPGLQAVLSDQTAIAVDFGDQLFGLALSGPGVEALFSRGSPLNLARHDAGAYVRTQFAQITIGLFSGFRGGMLMVGDAFYLSHLYRWFRLTMRNFPDERLNTIVTRTMQ